MTKEKILKAIKELPDVEYFVSSGTYNVGSFSPRYNTDGSLKINKECIYKFDVNRDE